MSIYSHDDKFPEGDRTDDRTLGEKLSDAAQEAGDKVKEGWDELTDDERVDTDVRQSGEGYGRHDIDRSDDRIDPPVDPVIRFDERR